MFGSINYIKDLVRSSFTSEPSNGGLARTQIAIGNIASASLNDLIPRSPDSTTSLDLCAESHKIYKPQSPPSLGKQVTFKANPKEQAELFAKRFFAYYTARLLSGARHDPQEYVEFADQTSKVVGQSPNNHTKDVWEAFKNTSLWKEMTITEKVKATAAYYLFGEIARNFLNDLLDNFTNFFIDQYSSEKDLESLFINILEKLNRSFINFKGTAEEFATIGPKNTTFEKYLEDNLEDGSFIQAIINKKSENALSEKDLFVQLGEHLLEKLLPKLQIKDAILHKLRWNVDGALNKAAWAVPYLISVILHIPLLILAYAFEGYANNFLKSTLQENLSPQCSELQKQLKKGWGILDGSVKGNILTYIYDQIEQLEQSTAEPISTVHLNPEVRKKVQTLVPAFLTAARLHSNREHKEAMRGILNPQSQTMIDKKIEASLVTSIEEALFAVFTLLTKDDFIANIIHTSFEALISNFTKDDPAKLQREIKEELLKKMQNIEDSIDPQIFTENPEIRSFFDTYKEEIIPYLDQALQNPQNEKVLVDHLNKMEENRKNFKDLFEASHPHSFRQMNAGLSLISRAQNQALEKLIQALRNKTKEQLDTKLQKIAKPAVGTSVEDLIGSKASTGLFEIERFFDRYKKQLTPYLQQVDEALKNPQNRDRLHSVLDLLDQHRTEMEREIQRFREIFGTTHPNAFRQIDEKLRPIARAQNQALENLVKAIKAQDNLNREIQQEKRLQELLETLGSSQKVKEFSSNYRTLFGSEFIEELTEENDKRIELELEIKSKENALSFLGDEMQEIYSKIAISKSLYIVSKDERHINTIKHLCSQIKTSLPPKYLERIQPLLKQIEKPLTQLAPVFNDQISELKHLLKGIQRELIKDIEISKKNVNSSTSFMKEICSTFGSLLNIEVFIDETSEYTRSALQNISLIQEKTSELQADPVVVVRPTQVISSAIGLLAGAILPFSAPAVVVGSAILGRSDPIYPKAHGELFRRIHPKIEETITSSLDLIFDNRTFRFLTQASAASLEDELSSRK